MSFPVEQFDIGGYGDFEERTKSTTFQKMNELIWFFSMSRSGVKEICRPLDHLGDRNGGGEML